MSTHQAKVLIVGGGAAGLSAALQLANHHSVTLLLKGEQGAGATRWAQGGMAGLISEEDHIDLFCRDVIEAGAGLSEASVVKEIIESSTEALHWLAKVGVLFTRKEADWDLTQEGGHGLRRIVHVDDATGLAISKALWAEVNAHPNIQCFTHQYAIDLIVEDGQCIGLYALDATDQVIHTYLASHVILATGGASKVYLYTTHKDTASGDGMAMAYRAGCTLMDMEFNQFHPTCLYHKEAPPLLLTEALRGEGAYLLNDAKERFMPKYHAMAELAPRDVVARAIDAELKSRGIEKVYLDISHLESIWIQTRFPTLYMQLLVYGFDLTQDQIPVIPAAHYTCGGIKAKINGMTDLPGLYAIGETAATGLHGANRLASTSLLECVVMGHKVAQSILSHPRAMPEQGPTWDASNVLHAKESVIVSHNWDATRRLMSNYFGILRSKERCEQTLKMLKCMEDELERFYQSSKLTPHYIECYHLITVAQTMVKSALLRQESRGLHCWQNQPHPDPSYAGLHSYISKEQAHLAPFQHD